MSVPGSGLSLMLIGLLIGLFAREGHSEPRADAGMKQSSVSPKRSPAPNPRSVAPAKSKTPVSPAAKKAAPKPEAKVKKSNAKPRLSAEELAIVRHMELLRRLEMLRDLEILMRVGR